MSCLSLTFHSPTRRPGSRWKTRTNLSQPIRVASVKFVRLYLATRECHRGLCTCKSKKGERRELACPQCLFPLVCLSHTGRACPQRAQSSKGHAEGRDTNNSVAQRRRPTQVLPHPVLLASLWLLRAAPRPWQRLKKQGGGERNPSRSPLPPSTWPVSG